MQPYAVGPRAGLSEDLLRESLGLTRGGRVRHGMDVLDTDRRVTEEKQPFTDWAVTWSYRAPDSIVGQQTDVAAVRRQATVKITGPVLINLLSRRLRLWTEWQLLDGTWARWHLGVFVVVNPAAADDDGVLLTRTMQLADQTYLLSLATVIEPVELPGSTVATDWVISDLASRFGLTAAAVSPSTATLGDDRLYEPGMTWLELYSQVLGAIGYDQLTADEEGNLASQSLSVIAGRGAEYFYGAGAGKIVTAGTVEPLAATLPNVLRFSARQGPSLGNVEGNGLYTVRNQSTGPGSIDSRGFEVEKRVDVDAADQPTLEAIGDAEKQRYFAGGGLKFTGRVALNPRFSDRDVIAIELPRLDVSGQDWQVTEWTYTAGDLTSDSSVLMPISVERRVA